ncbi:hypothetical protein [Priestia endophytica]|uniref:Uncharacterized protein n=1 Tax=Priestia endophytica TaxID=135735 RepID=A0AAX1Q9A9_9BACI|nr:hypothetical protein [Priestia endophytica]RAS77311.1 hypothetical protein A3864_11865 [Priestia endophytica]RAS86271.1 hypothetical protein A4R27_02405 [Priestia endophytica]RAS91721.1 hypothetical protein A3863_05030 [Priestia endophytica]
MVSLKDLYYSDSKVEFTFKLKDKRQIEEIHRYNLISSMNYGYARNSQEIVLTNLDIDTLKEQVENINNESYGVITLMEPDIQFLYVKSEDDLLALYITIDSGLVNAKMATDTGPTLKLITSKEKLITWVNDLQIMLKE